MTAPTTTFLVADVLGKVADFYGFSLSVEGIDDECYGMIVTQDKTFNDILVQHALLYNYQIIDGNPIRIVRRAVGTSLTIDYEINQTECITRNGGPVVTLTRVDVSSMPKFITVQYVDPARLFSITEQSARHLAAPTSNGGTSIQTDFIISAVQARTQAFDTLYRVWGRQLSCNFEHKDISIEPGDTITLTTDQGIFTILVQEATYTAARTTLVRADVLITSAGITIDAGAADAFVVPNSTVDESTLIVAGTP